MSDTFYYTDVKEFSSTFSERAYYNENTGKVVFETPAGETLTYTIDHDTWEDFTEAASQGRFFRKYILGVCEYHPNQDYLFFLKDQTVKSVPGFDLRAPEGAEEVSVKPASPDNGGKEYVVSATFQSFEEAYTLFSYAEPGAKHVSITSYSLEDGDE